MVIPALIIGGSALYLGARAYRRRHKQSNTWLSASHESLAVAPETPRVSGKVLTNLAIGAGVAAVGTAVVVAATHGVTPLVLTNHLITLLQHSAYGPLLFIAAYATLPLLLFPSTLLTLAAGSLFGPTQGILYTIIGSNLSALAAYQIGRRLRRLGKENPEENPEENAAGETRGETEDEQTMDSHLRIIQPFIQRMKANPFSTVLTMHCLFLPYEFVSYGAGLLGIPLEAFAPATTIGMLPWTFSLVLAGSSIQSTIITGFPAVDPAVLVASGVICVGSLALAGYLNGRHTATTGESAKTTLETQSELPIMVGNQLATVPVAI